MQGARQPDRQQAISNLMRQRLKATICCEYAHGHRSHLFWCSREHTPGHRQNSKTKILLDVRTENRTAATCSNLRLHGEPAVLSRLLVQADGGLLLPQAPFRSRALSQEPTRYKPKSTILRKRPQLLAE